MEVDAVVRGIRCGLAQGTEESGIKVGYTRNLVIEDRRAVGDSTVSFAKRTTAFTARDGDGCTVSFAERTTLLPRGNGDDGSAPDEGKTSMGGAAVEDEDASNREPEALRSPR